MRAFRELIEDIGDDLLEQIWLDAGVIDLVMWFPQLTWGQFLAASVAVLVWSWASEHLRRFMMFWVRHYLASGLIKLALFIAPRGGKPRERKTLLGESLKRATQIA